MALLPPDQSPLPTVLFVASAPCEVIVPATVADAAAPLMLIGHVPVAPVPLLAGLVLTAVVIEVFTVPNVVFIVAKVVLVVARAALAATMAALAEAIAALALVMAAYDPFNCNWMFPVRPTV